MSDIVDGFRRMVWRIEKYDGLNLIEEEQESADRITADDVVGIIEARAKAVLSAEEVENSPGLWRARRDYRTGTRLTFTTGENPHWVASMWSENDLPQNAKASR